MLPLLPQAATRKHFPFRISKLLAHQPGAFLCSPAFIAAFRHQVENLFVPDRAGVEGARELS
jgi:hypothetical protein